ncbi:MAG TPA: rhomboid family intramembrane serine protease [Steroidobacteraceae bacterium]|jgi:membrane associated rhomboid family serine protease|nr:rhomboid family intramembrane serine protease [Steroidobacteraceae bacterium]
MLDAVGIRSETRTEAPFILLAVDLADAARAREHLALYERERRPPPPPPPLPASQPHAWIGSVVYAVALVFIGLAVSNGLWRADAFDAGTLDSARVHSGQWWRAWTALTLHVNGQHLGANLLVGCLFGYLAGRQQGPGHAWFLILIGAAASNLIESLLTPGTYRAVGASTAVFTALGLLCAYTWGTGARWSRRWALQWAPLVTGAVLLAWFGSGDSDSPGQVDVVAHALGFGCGLLLGVATSPAQVRKLLREIPQWITGLLAIAQIAFAWFLALGR